MNIYHEDDKEGLRMFLRQPSAEDGKTNGEQLGLQRSDMEEWENNEEWVKKIVGLVWSNKSPKRLCKILGWEHFHSSDGLFYTYFWSNKKLSGSLDANKWTELTDLVCCHNKLTELKIIHNTKLYNLECSCNELTELNIPSHTIHNLDCQGNHLSLINLYDISKKVIETRYGKSISTFLGSQSLPPITILINSEINYSDPKILTFVDMYYAKRVQTEFSIYVYKGDHWQLAESNNYVIKDGKISFNNLGTYRLTMTNSAIEAHEDFKAEVSVEIKVITK
jgi:hypothetical protein